MYIFHNVYLLKFLMNIMVVININMNGKLELNLL